MSKGTQFVGMDVHAETIAVAVAEGRDQVLPRTLPDGDARGVGDGHRRTCAAAVTKRAGHRVARRDGARPAMAIM
jgi:hypothetical protein